MKEQKRKFDITWKVLSSVMILFIFIIANPCIGAEDPSKFPSKPIKIILSIAAGGNTDIVVRKIADVMTGILGQPVVVENNTGGSGLIGQAAIRNAKPDGYTMGNCSATYITAQLVSGAPFDIRKDYTFIGQHNEGVHIFCALTTSPYKTFKDYVEAARKNPGKLTWTAATPLGLQRMTMEYVFLTEKLKVTHMPMSGGVEATRAVLGGHVDAGASPSFIPFMEEGRVRGLAALAAKRFPRAAAVPTLIELGYDKYTSINYGGFAGPKGIDPLIVKKLSDALEKAVKSPGTDKLMEVNGMNPVYRNPKDFEEFVNAMFKEQEALFEDMKPIFKASGLIK